MGFLSKKSMLVSLLAVSLAACVSGSATGGYDFDLPCNGQAPDNKVQQGKKETVTFRISDKKCTLTDVNFTKNGSAFINKRHSAATSGDPVTFDYTGAAIDPAGAYYSYKLTPPAPAPSPDGSGGGIIHNK